MSYRNHHSQPRLCNILFPELLLLSRVFEARSVCTEYIIRGDLSGPNQEQPIITPLVQGRETMKVVTKLSAGVERQGSKSPPETLIIPSMLTSVLFILIRVQTQRCGGLVVVCVLNTYLTRLLPSLYLPRDDSGVDTACIRRSTKNGQAYPRKRSTLHLGIAMDMSRQHLDWTTPTASALAFHCFG